MKIVSRLALAAVAASGLVFGASSPAAAVGAHRHCLLTPSGWVAIAGGMSERSEAGDPALEQFHADVHWGEPGDQLIIIRIEMNESCADEPLPM